MACCRKSHVTISNKVEFGLTFVALVREECLNKCSDVENPFYKKTEYFIIKPILFPYFTVILKLSISSAFSSFKYVTGNKQAR